MIDPDLEMYLRGHGLSDVLWGDEHTAEVIVEFDGEIWTEFTINGIFDSTLVTEAVIDYYGREATVRTIPIHRDVHGRVWRGIPRIERCPTCGQPDNCGDCEHGMLTIEEFTLLNNA